MANLRTNNLSGEQGKNAYRGSVFFNRGTASAQGDSLEFSGIAIGTSDFTIEGWLYKTKTGNYPVIFDTRESGNGDSGGFFFGTNDDDYLYFYTQSTNAIKQTIISNFSWYHFALVRTGGTTTLYLNGQVSGTYSDSNNYSNDITKLGTSQQYTGGVQNNWNWGGYLSNIRIVVGSAVYTSTFTPPTQELTAVDNTMLLCCQDSDDPTQEATGKTITAYGDLHEGDDVELVTNSGFTVDISGWTASGVQFTHSSGALMHFGNGSTQRNIYQDVTTVIGRKYVARVLASSAEASTAYWQVGPTDDMTTVGYIADNNNSAQLEYKYYFTATSTTTRIRFYSYDSSNSSNVRSYWYLASIKLAPRTKAPKLIPPYGVDAGNTFGGAISMNSPSWMYFPTGTTEERGRGRGIIGWGANPVSPAIDFINIQSQGNAIRWGSLITTNWGAHGTSSSTRGLFAGGYINTPASTFFNEIEFLTIATEGKVFDFGNLSAQAYKVGALSDQIRAVFALGYVAPNFAKNNVIDFVTIATKGDASNFGDITPSTGRAAMAACSSTTRGLFAGGQAPSTSDIIDFITIASIGNATDFGNLSQARDNVAGTSNNTRAVFAGGSSPTIRDTIDFVTIASAGDAVDFGNLVAARKSLAGTSNNTRGIFAGGYISPATTNVMNFVTIATTGDAADFGDLSTARRDLAGFSDSHGGLS